MHIVLLSIVILIAATLSAAHADFEAATDAYNKGNYVKAYKAPAIYRRNPFFENACL